jgi:hypothetical protein
MLDPEIDMSEYIAESRDLFPVRFRVTSFEILRKIFDCFADYLEIPDNRIPASAIRNKFIVGNPGCILFNIAAASRISSRYLRAVLRIYYLAEDVGFKPFFYRAVHNEIDLTPEKIFQVELAVHVVIESLLSLPECNKNVHVAFLPLLSACE